MKYRWELFKDTHQRVTPGQLEKFRQAIQELLDTGVIKESKSPFTSPVVLVRTKDNSLRVCIDFWRLNYQTKIDSYPIPRVTENLQALNGVKYFCPLDLQSSYLQANIRDNDQPKTIMTTTFGLYEYSQMTFGLTNAPATFQRQLNTASEVSISRNTLFILTKCLRDLKKSWIYLVSLALQ